MMRKAIQFLLLSMMKYKRYAVAQSFVRASFCLETYISKSTLKLC